MSSRKDLRFVTSAEQMIPFLNRIQNPKPSQSTDEDDDEADDECANRNDPCNVIDGISKPKDKLTVEIAPPPPRISSVATTATIATAAVPNIYEEYVNFIDLSVLNPIVDANNCQRDTLTESEISEPLSIVTVCVSFPFDLFFAVQIKRMCLFVFCTQGKICKSEVNENRLNRSRCILFDVALASVQ